ncbi:uncharacterized protein SPAPADRAFT_63766 [Spathaspora passalidarum NRRL Y-27907]|uniref:Copper-fist domain-containing protein n=1 Tax=Spathaspora passalidarum (strain NRRL Y-27907 / 11-Y1) TaxID=619300 RepID=G3AVD9_SPAPN|nr:uncharacterized protein SPAPADRAFT_63766 [Spathaspora passalidarum NRRL Y-27907]EGW30158.1 hypothetical protein SPAPADRAFT_63766 [Spathaspora passalidarum NRRL Y-27907]
MECIRGHRSSSCKHHTRPLLQVRSKGRPNVYANGNPNHRIAVFAEEIAKEEPDSPDFELNKCKKSQPVVILKASPKQVIDLVSGVIVGPYDEASCQPSNVKPKTTPPVINSDSFINSSTCCNPTVHSSNVSKPNKSCGCCANKKKPVNKSKILESYIKKKIEKRINVKSQPKSTGWTWTFVNEYSPEADPSITVAPTKIKTEDESQIEQPQTAPSSSSSTQIFDVVSIPSCSIPGTCSCDENCTCAGCMVHGNSKASMNEIAKYLPLPDSNFNNNLQDSGNIIFNSVPGLPGHITTYPHNQRHDNSYANQFPNPTLTQSSPYQQDTVSNSSATASTGSASPNVCSCPSDGCDCTNCETHGIINGYKLDDYFKTHNFTSMNDLFNDFPMNGGEDIYSVMKQENDLLYEQLLKPSAGDPERSLLQQSQQQPPQPQLPPQPPQPPQPQQPPQHPQPPSRSCCSKH